eukprot:11213764-Lingulodinium_polyedra.AAC.1
MHARTTGLVAAGAGGQADAQPGAKRAKDVRLVRMYGQDGQLYVRKYGWDGWVVRMYGQDGHWGCMVRMDGWSGCMVRMYGQDVWPGWMVRMD